MPASESLPGFALPPTVISPCPHPDSCHLFLFSSCKCPRKRHQTHSTGVKLMHIQEEYLTNALAHLIDQVGNIWRVIEVFTQGYTCATLTKGLNKTNQIQEHSRHFGIGMKLGVELPDAMNTPNSLSLPLLSTIRLWKQVKDISQRTKRYNHMCGALGIPVGCRWTQFRINALNSQFPISSLFWGFGYKPKLNPLFIHSLNDIFIL